MLCNFYFIVAFDRELRPAGSIFPRSDDGRARRLDHVKLIAMSKTIKSASGSILVRTIEEVPRVSDAERADLLGSFEAARAEIAAGNYDVVISESLRAEFEAIFYHDETDAELDAELAACA